MDVEQVQNSAWLSLCRKECRSLLLCSLRVEPRVPSRTCFRHDGSQNRDTLVADSAVSCLIIYICCAVQFRKEAKDMVDFVCDYYQNVEGMPVRSSVEVRPQLLPYTAGLRQLPA